MTPVQRRYELELALRPTGRDGLEVAVGGRVGEVRGDLDGWARAAVRLTRGLTMQLGVDSRALHVVSLGPSGRSERDDRDLRATLGVELSLGTLGLSAFATAGAADGGVGAGLDGGTMIARLAAVPPPSVCCAGKRAERLTIEGDLGGRAGTALALRLRALAADASLAALVVTIESVSAGWATVHELRHELELVRRAGTKVYAYLMTASTKDYVLATAADKIFLDPAGSLGLVGLASTKMYWQGALEIVGAQPEFDKIAEYKSAPEQYTERGPTEAAARMHRELADGMMATVVHTIAGARGLSPAAVRTLIDAGPYHPGRLDGARELIDAVATPAQVAEQIGAELGDDVELEAADEVRADRWRHQIIAVIHADGEIADGASRSVPLLGTKVVGAQTIVGAIAAARADDRVGAIVLRIDSPGGSAVASELMAREVFATRGKKPILCSMGDVAASGGYYLAAGCDQIFADELTITGSIGIFSGKFDLSGTLGKLGVTTHTERRGVHADMDSLWRPYTPEERENVRGQLRYMYDRFVATVAEGRGMTVDEVDAVARGRVWTGVQAKAAGLVDTFGGLAETIAEAKRRMGLPALEPVQLWHLPKVRSGVLSLLMGGLRLRAAEPTVNPLELPAVRALLGLVPASVLLAPGQAQARIVPEWVP
jgi:protease-4